MLRGVLIVMGLLCVACSSSAHSASPPPASSTTTEPVAPPLILSAFFGLDHRLPPIAAAICPVAPGQDGLVVVVADGLIPDRVTAAAWSVTTQSGRRVTSACASLKPALDPDERRTVLLIGDLGTTSDPPVRVTVQTALPTVDPSRGARYRGAQSPPVIPLRAGPTLVYAERLAHPELGATPTGPAGCPVATKQVIQVAWTGGVTRPDHRPTSNADAARYHVTVRDSQGRTRDVAAIALADINDNDNYHELCLAAVDPAVAVRVDADSFVDPNGDLNPATRVTL